MLWALVAHREGVTPVLQTVPRHLEEKRGDRRPVQLPELRKHTRHLGTAKSAENL